MASLVPAIEDLVTRLFNVHWAGLQQAVAGRYDIASASDAGSYSTLISKDGTTWQDGFGSNTGATASGLARTVVGRNRKLVAFGKPRNGASCFISVPYRGNNIARGVLNDDGQLIWTTIATVEEAFSCVFAGGAFFISYYKEDGTELAVSFDGVNFSQRVEPFKGVENAAICNPDGVTGTPNPQSEGGSVAYDKNNNRYVTTGHYTRWYNYTYTNEIGAIFQGSATDQNFMSSVSDDGITWSPYFDQSEGWGLNNTRPGANDMEQRSYSPSSVCFGKGVFVAAASSKVAVDRVVPSGPSGFVLTPTYTQACAVATSADGASWAGQRLPETLSELDSHHLANGGDTQAVIFIRTAGKTQDGYPQGFFVALGSEFTNLYPEPGYSWQTKFWVSADGLSWNRTRTEDEKFAWILSAISKSAKPGSQTIIYI